MKKIFLASLLLGTTLAFAKSSIEILPNSKNRVENYYKNEIKIYKNSDLSMIKNQIEIAKSKKYMFSVSFCGANGCEIMWVSGADGGTVGDMSYLWYLINWYLGQP